MSLLKALSLPPRPDATTAPAGGATTAQVTPDAGSAKNATPAAAAPPAQPAAAAKPSRDLAAAADAWRQVQRDVAQAVKSVQAAARQQCAGLPPPFLASLEKGLATFDGLVSGVDGGVADALAAAATAADDTARKAQVAAARKAVKAVAGYVQGEPLIGLVDANPWGVSPGLRKRVVAGLQAAGSAVG